MLRELGIPYGTNQVFCRTCLAIAPNHNGGQYPQYCTACMKVFDGPQLYTLPDFVILRDAILNVNGEVHEKQKNVRKDRDQVQAILAAGKSFFVINNSEVDNMTNSTLKLYLLGIWAALKGSMYEKVYRNEKEYACLRN
jgi:hypothetical protein